jgi:hypothetical protein
LRVKLPGGGTGQPAVSATAAPCLSSILDFANLLDNDFCMSIMPQSTFSDLALLDPEEAL